MKKIVSLFQRNYAGDRLVRDQVTEGAEWVIAGEGVATAKFDGTCCMFRNGKLYARYDAKAFTVDKATGKKHAWDRKPPPDFEPAQEADTVTGHLPGWIPVKDQPEYKWHREAERVRRGDDGQYEADSYMPDGTYELVGPKVQSNPQGIDRHQLWRHGSAVPAEDPPRNFDGLKAWLADKDYEGLVWHHPDGRMVKLKRRDLGYPWPIKK